MQGNGAKSLREDSANPWFCLEYIVFNQTENENRTFERVYKIAINEVWHLTHSDKDFIIKQSECNSKGKYVEMCLSPQSSSTKDAKLDKKIINDQIWLYISSINQMPSFDMVQHYFLFLGRHLWIYNYHQKPTQLVWISCRS